MTPQVLGSVLFYKKEHLLGVTFKKTNSKNFQLVTDLCRSAQAYHSDNDMHIAVFARSVEEAERAHMVLEAADGWKSLKVFINGRLQWNSYAAKDMIECFLESTKCNDMKAHCYEVIDDPDDQPPRRRSLSLDSEVLSWITSQNKAENRYIFPCKKLLNRNFQADTSHPSSIKDQIQAYAVKVGCDTCPNFSAENFRLADQSSL